MINQTKNIVELRQYFQNISLEELQQLIHNQEFTKISMTELNIIFLNLSDDKKKILLSDCSLLEKILSLPPNRLKKEILDLVSEEIRNFIFNSETLKHSKIAQEKVKKYLEKLPLHQFYSLLSNSNLNTIFNDKILEDKHIPLDSYLEGLVENAKQDKNFSSLALLKIENEWELLIYTKFHLLVKVNSISKDKITILGKTFTKEYFQKVSRKQMNSLIEISLSKDHDISHEELLITLSKMYIALGYDNTKKILEDNFTYATPASIKRASIALIKDKRREFRLENQEKFYYFGIEKDILSALDKNDILFFENFCGYDLRKNAFPFMSALKEVRKIPYPEERKEQLKNLILKVIKEREDYYEQKEITRNIKHYKEVKRKDPIKLKELYAIFSNIKMDYQFNHQGKSIPNQQFSSFLLGNYKKDNDCLLRMVFNHEALGLEECFPMIIKNYASIEEKIINDNSLSIHSILDIIDISKLFLYQQKPDETDITLSTFSKILKSRKYCTEPPEEILRRTLELHKKRKRKIAGALPKIYDSFESAFYQSADYDDEYLLVSGIDTGSCFKVGGKGEEFLNYCLLNPCGTVFYIDYLEVRYVIPATVNGNMLNLNSIDPVIKDPNLFFMILKILKKMSNQIIEDKRCDIDLVTITDIHYPEYMSQTTDEKIDFKHYIPLRSTCYNDYMKKEVTNYIIAKKENALPKYYDNPVRIPQKRNKPYIFDPTTEFDQERLHMLINSIYYSSIEEKAISEKEKREEKEFYIPLEVKDFLVITGNKDWFVGINKNYQIISACLSYDERAKDEYQKNYNYLQVLNESKKKSLTKNTKS